MIVFFFFMVQREHDRYFGRKFTIALKGTITLKGRLFFFSAVIFQLFLCSAELSEETGKRKRDEHKLWNHWKGVRVLVLFFLSGDKMTTESNISTISFIGVGRF